MISQVWSRVALWGIVMIAVMRCVIVFVPQVYFDVDPALDPNPLAGMGMAGSLMLDVLLLVMCAIGLFTLAASGRIRWGLVVLALLPAPVIIYHGMFNAGDIWRGATWMAAVPAGVIVMHLGRDRAMRIVIASLLLAVIAPLLLRGFAQMTYEHADTVTAFEQHREAFLLDRGWEEDSPAAQIYERRLRQPQPAGWFFTTNIYASVMVVAAVVLAGVTLGASRTSLPSGWIGLTGLLAALCAVMVYFTGSKGAMLALGGGIVICLLPLASARFKLLAVRFGPHMLIAMILGALCGIAVRGVILPEGFLSEKSLLFRWHYLVSSVDVFVRHWRLGVGPDGFQAAYMQFRQPRNPEEVISAHSVFTDWLVTVGLIGGSWVVLIWILIRQAGSAIRNTANEADRSQNVNRIGLLMTCGVAVVALGVGLAAEFHVLDALGVFVRLMGVVGYAALALVLMHLLLQVSEQCLNWSLATAATALVVHGQIEMTFFLHGSVVWSMCIVGLAGGGISAVPVARSVHSTWIGYTAGAVAATAAAIVFFTFALPSAIQQQRVHDAAAMLYPLHSPHQRIAAAETLEEAYELHRTNPQALFAAIRQLELAAHESPEAVSHAIKVADLAVAEHPGLEAFMTRASLRVRSAMMTVGELAWQEAIADAIVVTKLDPHSNMSWMMLGDFYWAADMPELAAQAYETALANDANFELDPLKQLPARRRAMLEQRIAEVQGE